MFFGIALIVLAIACINFMNLSTARSAERAREVGVRKSVGAHRWQLGAQFIGESLLLSLIALFIALILVETLLPVVNNLIQRRLQLPNFGFDSLGTIVGIAKDFNFNSLHHAIETMFLFNQKEWGFSNLSIKISGQHAKEALPFIQYVWQCSFPDHPFEYQFLDEHFAEVYRADAQVSTIVGVLAGLAVFISCLGLFGLASYSAKTRVKEIGIRKVLGASVQHIGAMLSADFLKYVLVAALLALPLAWIAVDAWLQDYAYRVSMSWWIFGIAVLIATLIAFITISFQAIRAAIANPVESLRNE
ncbi:putative ABC transport system permease protein [bacterium A37T11]|nr:putative ABC transport system permease protein [bacterium A37T11]